MATTDEDLNQLEKDVRQLKIDYEQYFGGGRPRPPTDTEWRIESLLKRYSDRAGAMNFNQRFRYSNLAQTHAKYKEMFRKRLKQKEEGVQQRHFGAAAREIEAQRALRRAAEEKKDFARTPFAVSWNDPDNEQKKVDQLFAAFRAAKAQAGEDTNPLTIDAFQEFVRQKTKQLKSQKDVQEVEYVVTVEGNHARLKARVKS